MTRPNTPKTLHAQIQQHYADIAYWSARPTEENMLRVSELHDAIEAIHAIAAQYGYDLNALKGEHHAD
jgi:hypothetical protein